MSFDWSDYLTLADALSRQPTSPGPEEASLRSAISRAYYAAFGAARNFVRDRGEILLTREASDHEIVINHYRRSTDRNRREIGKTLRYMRDKRNDADYEDTISKPDAEANVAVLEAARIIKLLKKL